MESRPLGFYVQAQLDTIVLARSTTVACPDRRRPCAAAASRRWCLGRLARPNNRGRRVEPGYQHIRRLDQVLCEVVRPAPVPSVDGHRDRECAGCVRTLLRVLRSSSASIPISPAQRQKQSNPNSRGPRPTKIRGARYSRGFGVRRRTRDLPSTSRDVVRHVANPCQIPCIEILEAGRGRQVDAGRQTAAAVS